MNPGTGTSVYVNGFAAYSSDPWIIANSSGVINLTTGYPDTAWCNTHASNPPSAADKQTAFTDGSRCRLNGRAYGPFTDPSNLWSTPSIAAGYNYPNFKNVATGVNTACSGVNVDCVFRNPGAVTANPYYYTISNVQFCSSIDAAGFGTGTCQDRFDTTTYKYVRYGNLAQSFDPQAFVRVDIVPAVATYPSGRTYAAELANFAKWYTFYRTRMQGMKTAGGIAFSALSDENARVGYHTLWENTSATAGFLNVGPFDPTQKAAWFNRFYAAVPSFGTPLPDAVFRIGEYFSNSGISGLPGVTDPLDATTGMCQPNYHLLSTDGYWNYSLGQGTPQYGPTGAVISPADQDRTVPSLGNLPGNTGFTPGSNFPAPLLRGTGNEQQHARRPVDEVLDQRPPSGPRRQRQGHHRAVAARYALWVVDWRAGNRRLSDGNRCDQRRHRELADADRLRGCRRSRFDRRPLARGDQQPRQVSSTPRPRRNWRRASSARWPISPISRVRARPSASRARNSPQRGISATRAATRPAGGATSRSTRSTPTPARCRSTMPAIRSIRQYGPRRRSSMLRSLGTGWDTNRRIVTINDSSNVAVPFRHRESLVGQQTSLNAGWSVVLAPADRAGGARLSSRRQVERGRTARPISGCVRMRSATSATRAR